MAGRIENLKSYKPGVSGNPKGRPVGLKSIKTHLRELMTVPLPDDMEGMKQIRTKFPFWFTGNDKNDMNKLAALRLITGILANDNDYALKCINAIMDRLDGRPQQKMEVAQDPQLLESRLEAFTQAMLLRDAGGQNEEEVEQEYKSQTQEERDAREAHASEDTESE